MARELKMVQLYLLYAALDKEKPAQKFDLALEQEVMAENNNIDLLSWMHSKESILTSWISLRWFSINKEEQIERF